MNVPVGIEDNESNETDVNYHRIYNRNYSVNWKWKGKMRILTWIKYMMNMIDQMLIFSIYLIECS